MNAPMPVMKENSITCPRCATRVSPDYRYCPECAYRIHAGSPEAATEPAAPRSIWPHLLVVLGALGLVGGFILAGVALFHAPERAKASPPPPAHTEGPQSALGLNALADNLVWHPEAFAEWHNPPARTGFGPEVEGDEEPESLEVWVAGIYVSRYEVSRGQWRAFLDDLAGHDTAYRFQYVWKQFFRPLEALAEHLCDTQHLLLDDLERPGGFEGDAVFDAVLQARRQADYATHYVGKAQEFAEYWWRAVAEHNEAPGRSRIERPLWSKTLPVPNDRVLWLITPPAWVHIDGQGVFTRVLDEAAANLPVTEITLPGAIAFGDWASDKLKMHFYVPTRSEFMRAYHDDDYPEGDHGNRWPWGYELHVYLCNSATLWAQFDTEPRLFDVDRELGNVHLRSGDTRRGLVHMAGNAREWVQPQNYLLKKDPETGRRYYYVEGHFDWDGAGTMGGSYLLGIEDCDYLASWTERSPLVREIDVGFRLVARGGPGVDVHR